MILELTNVEKDYKLDNNNNFKALKGISISFNKGELVSIIGESGSGKSTLMNIIGGLDSNFTGSVKIEGVDISDFSEKELDRYRKNKIGFVFQSFNLIPHLTVLDNVTIAMTLSNEKKTVRKERAKQILSELGLEDQINKKPNQLSGGQKQRVAIARALVNDPDIILADEPTGSLDFETSKQILDIIKEIAKKGKLVVMVTHSEKVAQISTRVIKIADGKIIEDNQNDSLELNEENEENLSKEKQNLSLFSSIRLALNNMREKKTRNILVSLGASIGILSVITMLAVGNGVHAYIENTMNGFVNPLVIGVNKKEVKAVSQMSLDDLSRNFMASTSEPFEEEDIKKLSSIDNVVKVEKGISLQLGNATRIKYDGRNINVQVFTSISSNITQKNIAKGRMPKENEILISESIEKELNTDMIGKIVNLKFAIEGKLLSIDAVVSGIYSSSTTSLIDNMTQTFINYSDVEKLAKDNGIDLKPDKVYLISTSKDHINDIEKNVVDLGYEGGREEKMGDMFLEMLNVMTYILSAVAAISLVVSAIMILVVLYISVIERTKEIGVLKAIGARRKDIKRIFVAESFLIGLGSGLAGSIGAIILMFIINAATNKLFNVSLVAITIPYVIFGIIVSIIISMISGMYPASKAAKLDPVDSLRRE